MDMWIYSDHNANNRLNYQYNNLPKKLVTSEY